eukprot:5357031-Amphidinium_carterae.1
MACENAPGEFEGLVIDAFYQVPLGPRVREGDVRSRRLLKGLPQGKWSPRVRGTSLGLFNSMSGAFFRPHHRGPLVTMLLALVSDDESK